MVRLSLCRCIATILLCTQCAGDTTYDVQIATTWAAEDQRLASMQVNFNNRPSLSCTNFENTTDPHVFRNRNAETRCIVRCKDGLRPLQSCHVVSAYVLAGGSVVDISAREEAARHIAVVEGDGRAIGGRRLEWEAWDGCYTGSDKGMRLNIGVVADQGFYEINGNTDASVKAHITQLMAFASITFEEQMNVELVVADMLLPGSGTGGAKTLVEQKPKAGTGKCRSGWESSWSGPMTTHFGNKYAVLVYLTDCHTDQFGGLAQGFGGACAARPQCVVRHRDAKSRKRPGYESDDETGGVRNEHKSDSKFVLLHEIGHVVGGQHSFENRNYGSTSKGKGYGIMDYYTDGKWKDEVQFASKHKTHICKVFEDMRSSPRRENCFTEGLTPTTTPAATTPVPATNPTTPSDVTTPASKAPQDDNDTWKLIAIASGVALCMACLFCFICKKGKKRQLNEHDEGPVTPHKTRPRPPVSSAPARFASQAPSRYASRAPSRYASQSPSRYGSSAQSRYDSRTYGSASRSRRR